MLSRGTVHSIGGKEIGCCCSITAVPGPALTLTLSRGQPTVNDRPHCESFNIPELKGLMVHSILADSQLKLAGQN